MKNTLSEMKSILEGIRRVEEKEDRNTDIEDGEAKDTQPEQQEKNNQEYNNNLRSLWDKIKDNNIHVIGIPEEAEQDVEYIFEDIMMENFLNPLEEITIQAQETQSLPRI